MTKVYIQQNKDSEGVTVACRLVTDDDPQVQLIPGEWVKVATCDNGNHILRVGTMHRSGNKKVTFSMKNAKRKNKNSFDDEFIAPSDGNSYQLKVAGE
ncbi:MAG: hypothetical protein GKR93_14545 [Gammaproteobacteria bacterium]|nr:hypothetical protein [Gammaproteobacteria bacterium]